MYKLFVVLVFCWAQCRPIQKKTNGWYSERSCVCSPLLPLLLAGHKTTSNCEIVTPALFYNSSTHAAISFRQHLNCPSLCYQNHVEVFKLSPACAIVIRHNKTNHNELVPPTFRHTLCMFLYANPTNRKHVLCRIRPLETSEIPLWVWDHFARQESSIL